MATLLRIGIELLLCYCYTLLAKHYGWWPFNKKGRIDPNDPIVEAIAEWVEECPEEANTPIKSIEVSPGVYEMVSGLDILVAMRANSDFGRREYKTIVRLTLDLLHRGKIKDTKD